jgi:hypothetical protein
VGSQRLAGALVLGAIVASAGGVARAQAPAPAAAEPLPGAASAADLAALRAQLALQQKQLEDQRQALEELRATADAATDALSGDVVEEPTFRLFGFIDMGLQRLWSKRDDPITPTQKTTFVLGNINLYFDFRPVESWSSLVEVRLTSYPRGSESPGIPALGVPYERTSTTVFDPGNGPGSDTVSWGSIILERAYIQWRKLDWLGVRVGQFLTPYGIWNVDHGTPTLITMYRPKAQVNEIWPTTQLGVNAFGTLRSVLPAPWLLEWNAYVSNGRTPGPVDPTDAKMVGGRFAASTTRPHPMTFGVSFLLGEYSDQAHNFDIVTEEASRPERIAYVEQGGALDASVDLGRLRLRSELTFRRLEYDEGKREESWLPNVYQANRLEWDVYGLAAYRVPGTPFEPYGYVEAYHWPTLLGDGQVAFSAGLNTYITPSIQLKLQYSYEQWVTLDDLDPGSSFYWAHFTAAKLVMGL